MRFVLTLVFVAVGFSAAAAGPYSKWSRGPDADPGFFPLALWLQNPVNAERYRKAGFNTYIALWKGPTEEQLDALKKAGMRLFCEQNEIALRHLEDPVIAGWMHGDEPDNAQSLGANRGWGPPVPPEKIEQDYHRLQARDPSRPVLLNLGQGVAWDGWYGRGSRSRHPEDYPEYLEGCDIVSFDIYPVVHENKEVAGKLWLVADGVERLKQWSGGRKVVWNCLECTRISNPDRKPTPQQVRTEAWMSLIHGSQGLIFFVHEFKPKFREAALLDDAEMLEAISALNHQITRLAAVLNSPTLNGQIVVGTQNHEVPVAIMAKQYEGATYVFAVAMREGATTATFTFKKTPAPKVSVEVIDENRSLEISNISFQDRFTNSTAHLYRITSATNRKPGDPASTPKN
jgi:hypothetical protein